ncbi:16S rRNA (cytosine(1402)-N(4))-methyltransferase RsmH [Parvularcula sp. IMCC14364]|uniref:16S rRNA (cytosine(1402)-N(4))-methyltransferase RsmH n=1 Tax=Parvularcula sp. IMCC14364 TaxID=3067902 RepID=UPI0027428BBF|nr:16S rRNA (cytosine(1402)-N(4))-methyltransferase RsmH [Parvularcula sp. IMCC14364]
MTDRHSREFGHLPVLAQEAVEALALKAGETYVDATMGGGGYTRMMLDHTDCQVIAFDRDPAATKAAEVWSHEYADRLHIVQRPFAEMATALAALDVAQVHGVVMDLGVSSLQLDEGARGFSFRHDGPLNMRMDQQSTLDATELLNKADEKDLADIFYIYGEEKKSRIAAREIVRVRQDNPISTTGQLRDILEHVLGPQGREKIHPATRIFQAIRIFVNDELGQLAKGLLAAERVLVDAGRLAVVTFHSLEDRVVKRFLAQRSALQQPGSRHMPDISLNSPKPTFSLLSRRPVTASDQEVQTNPRARSAKLRAALRTDAVAGDAGPDFLRSIGLPQPVFSTALRNWS